MKLNANIKKRNFIIGVWNEYVRVLDSLDDEIKKIEENIDMDIEGIRLHNPDYLSDKF